MYKNESVLVTGGTGFLGKAVVANLKDNGYQNVHAIGSSFDLTTTEDTKLAFDKFEPKAVIHLAATVGGIEANRQKNKLNSYTNTVVAALGSRLARAASKSSKGTSTDLIKSKSKKILGNTRIIKDN